MNKDILEIDNMDDIVEADEDEDDQSTNQLHFLLPKHPARILICGTSGAGKSNLLSVMLLKQLVWDKIYCFSRHLEQSKYLFLHNHLTNIEDSFKKSNLNIKILEAWENVLDKLPKVEDLDKSYRNLIIIDDFAVSSKKEMDKISDLFVRGRHKNTTIIFLTQLYFKCSRDVKLNCSHIILFQSYNKRELSSLSADLGSDLPKGEFQRLYNTILSKKYNFMVIDNTTIKKELRYREKWNGLYSGDIVNNMDITEDEVIKKKKQ
jgi:hypothetical protein